MIFLTTVSLSVFIAPESTTHTPHTLFAGLAFFTAVTISLGTLSLRYFRGLEKLSLHDGLTALPNRRALLDRFRQSRSDTSETGIALLNLDNFKLINENHGHRTGDEALLAAAHIVRDVCGPEVEIYRLGGDEFALILKGSLSGTLLEGHCRRIVEYLTKPVQIANVQLLMGASIGLASCRGENCSASELLRRADMAMAASKRGGKMRCTWYSASLDRNREEMRRLDDDLRRALTENEFRLVYQPLVSSEDRRVVSVECLLRWDRPAGPIGPHIFIPAAEQSGFINAIGLWVLRQACRDALAWKDITLSVNISAAQLRNPEFPVQLGYILEETGFDADRLELEITETCLVLDPVIAERNLALIRQFGVRIALDDFGTGYASIGFLRQFRFEKLKIDRSLVVQASEDEGSRAMMLSSIAVARAMKMGVTAEGVETEEQAAMVRAAGCDQIQGWLYYRAMPAQEIAQYLTSKANSTTSSDQGIRAA
ncbi:bifunctional diguanylate cyclase/phosphodiesterase [Erythrobacter litoralis]|nr:bifunctional diguanylate cyclase/phosphodiesterase [Erythrobacter litoralis]